MSIFTDKKEEGVYKALLVAGESSVVALAKKTKIHRPNLYKMLSNLMEEGLVETATLGKRMLYKTTSREVLEKKIADAKKAAEEDARSLLSLANETQTVTNIDTREGIVALFNEMAEVTGERGDYYSFTTRTDKVDLEKYFSDTFRNTRDRKDLWSHVLTDKPIDMKKGVRFNLEIKQVDTTSLEQDCLWVMYGDKYAFVDFTTESGYIVKNKKLAKFQRDIFKFYYNKA